MIFPRLHKKAKSKLITAVADFYTQADTQGKIVSTDFSNLTILNGLQAQDSFAICQKDVLQFLPTVDGKRYVLTSEGVTNGEITLSQFAGCKQVVFAFDDITKTLVVSHEQGGTVTIFNTTVSKICDNSFISMSFCQSRLFALDGNKVYFSNPCDFSALDNFVVLPTPAVSIVANGYLYAIGKDIYKLEMDADDTYANVRLLATNVGNVVASTVRAYANKILFVADGDIQCLQNGNVKAVCNLHFQPTLAICFAGLYYLADSQKLFVGVNAHNGKVVCRYQMHCDSLFADKCLIVVSLGQGYALTHKPQASYWKSQVINFCGEDCTKYLHRLTIQTLYNVDIHVISDSRRIYHLKGKDGIQSLLISGFGKDISVQLHAQGKVNVKSLSLTARVYGVTK